jgi:UDP-glucose 4-epimerase
MKILVTGGAGYIGSICAERLLERGYDVAVFDSLHKGHRAAVPPAAKFYEGDTRDAAALDRVFTAERPDAVMHFAALIVVPESVEKPELYHEVNVGGSGRLLDAMARHGVANFIFSSTAAVYGEPTEVPIPEDAPTHPVNPYGATKLAFEKVLTERASRSFGTSPLRFVSLRYFNVAGASAERGEDHHPETHVIPLLLEAAAGRRDAFTIYGRDYPTPDGTCIRDYVHVLDLVDAHILALEQLDRVAGRVFNVGNSRGFSVLEVVEAARRVTGRSIATRDAPRRPGDSAVLVAGSARLRQELCWQPKHSDLDAMVASAWEWRRRHPRGYANS